MAGNIRPFPDIEIKEDCWYEDLVTPSKYDDDCASLLSVMLPALAKLAGNRFQDHLPGGIYSDPSKEFKQQTKSVPVHNKLCETVFARADFLLQNKPNVSTIALESYIMFSFNKTSEWLDGKEKSEQQRILADSYRKVKSTQEKFLSRKSELTQQRSLLLKQKFQEAEKARRMKEGEKMALLQDITYYG